MDDKKLSKFLSLVLRHRPEVANLKLDESGWADLKTLIRSFKLKGWEGLTFEDIARVVSTNNKKRFAFNANKTKIRASQGHSIKVDLGLQPQTPPDKLYHGTISEFLPSIKREGLKKRKRQHVHLSADTSTAVRVGSRRGKPVILAIDAKRMNTDYQFFLSANKVWLADAVPTEYILWDEIDFNG